MAIWMGFLSLLTGNDGIHPKVYSRICANVNTQRWRSRKATKDDFAYYIFLSGDFTAKMGIKQKQLLEDVREMETGVRVNIEILTHLKDTGTKEIIENKNKSWLAKGDKQRNIGSRSKRYDVKEMKQV